MSSVKILAETRCHVAQTLNATAKICRHCGSSNRILGRVVTGRKGKGKGLTCQTCGGVGHDARLCPGGGGANSLNEELASGEGLLEEGWREDVRLSQTTIEVP